MNVVLMKSIFCSTVSVVVLSTVLAKSQQDGRDPIPAAPSVQDDLFAEKPTSILLTTVPVVLQRLSPDDRKRLAGGVGLGMEMPGVLPLLVYFRLDDVRVVCSAAAHSCSTICRRGAAHRAVARERSQCSRRSAARESASRRRLNPIQCAKSDSEPRRRRVGA